MFYKRRHLKTFKNNEINEKNTTKIVKQIWRRFILPISPGSPGHPQFNKKHSKICKKYGIWLHVDAAMAGPVALCPEYRHILDGLEYADSYSFNPHKWMLTSFDCSLFYVMDRAKLIQSLTIMPEYLKNANSQKEEVFDFRDWGIPLGRRFRSLKLWHVINYYGINGLQASIREHMANTQKLKSWIEQDKRFEIVAPVPLTLICFRLAVGCKKTMGFNQNLKLILILSFVPQERVWFVVGVQSNICISLKSGQEARFLKK